jgi:hypothetical protein
MTVYVSNSVYLLASRHIFNAAKIDRATKQSDQAIKPPFLPYSDRSVAILGLSLRIFFDSCYPSFFLGLRMSKGRLVSLARMYVLIKLIPFSRLHFRLRIYLLCPRRLCIVQFYEDDTTRYDAVHRCSVSILYSDYLLYKDQSTPYPSYRSQQGH